MNGIRLKAALFTFLVIGIATTANSQTNKKYEAFGSVGAVSYSDTETSMDYGGGFGIRPFGTKPTWMQGWELELSLSITNRTWDDYVPTQTRYTANILYHFLSGRVQPYALIGFGGYHEPGNVSPPSGSGFISQNSFLANAGGGLRVVFNDRWSIRPEYRGFNLKYRDSFARYAVFVGYHF